MSPSSSHNHDDRWGAANFALNAANALQLLQVQRNQAELSAKLDASERQQAERSYSHWRQTPDGQYYEAWKAEYSPRITTILNSDNLWAERSDQLVRENLSEDEYQSSQTGDWMGPTWSHRYVKILLAVAISCFLALLLLSSLGVELLSSTPVLMALFFGFLASLFSAIIISVFGTKFPFWANQNREKRNAASAALTEAFGVDPLSPDEWPLNIWANDSGQLATRAAELIANEVTHHPSPNELPQVPHPEVIPDERLRVKALLADLRSIRRHVQNAEGDQS